jgi:hypothetical protein
MAVVLLEKTEQKRFAIATIAVEEQNSGHRRLAIKVGFEPAAGVPPISEQL